MEVCVWWVRMCASVCVCENLGKCMMCVCACVWFVVCACVMYAVFMFYGCVKQLHMSQFVE